MHVVHDNFVALPANARELALAVQNREELNNLWHFAKHRLSLTSIVEK